MTMLAQKRGRSKQDYGTPWSLIRSCGARFGTIVCDLAASAANTKAPCWYGEDRDSLFVPWALENPDGVLWLNPPFAQLAPWAAKCRAESAKRCGFLLLLTPASVGAKWFAEHVAGHAYVLGLRPRITFEGATDPYPKDCTLSVFGHGLRGFDTWQWDG